MQNEAAYDSYLRVHKNGGAILLLSSGNLINSFMDEASCGFAASPVTKLDTKLSYNGELTQTYMLLADSNAVCINPYTGSPLQWDQRVLGNVHPVDDDANGIATRDFGAREAQ